MLHEKALKPQLIHHCGEAHLRTVLGITPNADVSTWMTRERTEAALLTCPLPAVPT